MCAPAGRNASAELDAPVGRNASVGVIVLFVQIDTVISQPESYVRWVASHSVKEGLRNTNSRRFPARDACVIAA